MNERDKVYLGALLHDIGKFHQRGDKEFKFTRHPVLSAVFLNNLLNDEVIAAIVANHQIDDLRKSQLSDEIKKLATIVCEADSLASGERQPSEGKEQKPLLSILSKISLDKLSCQEFSQPLSSLTPKGYEFPKKDWTTSDLVSSYEKRWKEFIEEVELFGKHISLENIDAIKNTIHALSSKYLWCIPSASYLTKPDVSLHEHHRLAAAIAICMYDYLQENPNENIENRQTPRYRLFCADLTGIQKYLYNIKPKGAAKALKGRSFLLQQQLDAVANFILAKLNLERANLLYSSGGKFFLLLPNFNEIEQTLLSIEEQVTKKLLDEYGTGISIVFATTPLSGNDLASNRVPEKWDEVQKKLQLRKFQKFSKIFSRDFFLPDTPAGELIVCSATDLELCTSRELEGAQSKNEEVEKLGYKEFRLRSKKIYQQIETGEFISSEQFVAQQVGKRLREGECLAIGGNLKFDTLGLESFDLVEVNQGSINAKTMLLLNDDDFINKLPSQYSRGFRFYGGNWSLETDYDHLVEKCTGLKRLGVLRLDVDNLGRVFKDGLGKQAIFSRVIQLSTMLDFFFSSYINQLKDLKWSIEQGVNETEGTDIKELIEIVYSGGDDVFIVGIWNALPDVALWIYENFKKFTCYNPCFTLSAGIALFDTKEPLYTAAIKAGEYEERAKGKRYTKQGEKQKDAIYFLKTNVSWSDFRVIREEVIKLYSALESKKISRGVIQRLLSIYSEFEAHYETLKSEKGVETAQKEMLYGRWRWVAAYSLARLARQYKDYENEINTLSSKLFLGSSTEQDFISLTNLLAQWADYLTRKEK